MKKKVVIAHPGKQHSFRIATALKKEQMLYKYITTVYNSDKSLIMKLIKRSVNIDNNKRILTRKNHYLDDTDVIQFFEVYGLIEILLSRYDKRKKVYNWWHSFTSKKFGEKVAKFAIDNEVSAVILYDTNSKECFEILKEKNPEIKKIMDVSAANRVYMQNIFEKNLENIPKLFAEKLTSEVSDLWETKKMSYFQREIELSDYFLVPSNFVKTSLMFSGVGEEKIFVCPYGTNFKVDQNIKETKKQKKISIVYVGNVTQSKGIYYMLEALKSIPNHQIEVNIVGNFDNQTGVFNDYINLYNFAGRQTHDVVMDYLKKADIFVFPSLGEGMTLAGLEAMALGLPIICTSNSGINDLIIDGYNGFVVPIENTKAIKDKIQWFIENKDEIPQMSQNAKKVALEYSWENYEENVSNIISKILNN
ncbi:MAG: hypothetical protein PWR19_1964 [Carnobacterium sp.]|uniref:glycosyltransferase family 4 protein n=1 Tax=Carnobacterium sp. TaxID=48221 RepID=UPI002649130C|nr:glycosyltransferase family 4 protein [Carnobacterium sp.]MDN5372918.1 hypothetical protein [Carnobacterium sp.]